MKETFESNFIWQQKHTQRIQDERKNETNYASKVSVFAASEKEERQQLNIKIGLMCFGCCCCHVHLRVNVDVRLKTATLFLLFAEQSEQGFAEKRFAALLK